MYDPQSSSFELADFRKIQEEISRSIGVAVQFYIKTNVYSIIAWLFLIVGTNYFLVFPSTSGAAGFSSRYKVMELAIAITMVIIGIILNASAWADISDKTRRLEALKAATYDLARERGSRDIVEREWLILGDMAFSGQRGGKFVHSLQFLWFLLIHIGLALLLIII